MKHKKYKKPRSLLFRIFIFIVKIPLYIFSLAPEPEDSKTTHELMVELAEQNPTILDPHPPKKK